MVIIVEASVYQVTHYMIADYTVQEVTSEANAWENFRFKGREKEADNMIESHDANSTKQITRSITFSRHYVLNRLNEPNIYKFTNIHCWKFILVFYSKYRNHKIKLKLAILAVTEVQYLCQD